MKKFFIVSGLILVYFGFSASYAQNTVRTYVSRPINNIDKAGELGVGLQVGGLSGFNLEYWSTHSRTMNLAIASERGNTAASLAYHWMFWRPFADSSRVVNDFVPYIGVGALLAFGSQGDYFDRRGENLAAAVQMPLGLEFLPRLQRFSVFAEVDPNLEVTPLSSGFITADLGGRFYF